MHDFPGNARGANRGGRLTRGLLCTYSVFMPTVRFTDNIQRHVACPDREVEGRTVRAVLDAYFTGKQAAARGYVLDDQGALWRHMAIFVDGEAILDRDALADRVKANGTVDVVQALSGG